MQVKFDKLDKLTEDSIKIGGKPRLKDCHLRDAFDKAMDEVRDDMKLMMQDISGSKTTDDNDTQKRFGIASEVFSRVPVVKRILKACSIRAAVVLNETIKSVVETPRDEKT